MFLCCRCKAGRAGTFSECEQEESGTAVDSHLCRRDNASEVCSGTESAFAGGVFVKRAAKSPAMCTMGSCVSAVISAVISTEDYNVEV